MSKNVRGREVAGTDPGGGETEESSISLILVVGAIIFMKIAENRCCRCEDLVGSGWVAGEV